MGLLAYTYGTNGIPLPEGKPYLVSLIDEQKIIADIASKILLAINSPPPKTPWYSNFGRLMAKNGLFLRISRF